MVVKKKNMRDDVLFYSYRLSLQMESLKGVALGHLVWEAQSNEWSITLKE